jgi:hypothetical protein
MDDPAPPSTKDGALAQALLSALLLIGPVVIINLRTGPQRLKIKARPIDNLRGFPDLDSLKSAAFIEVKRDARIDFPGIGTGFLDKSDVE